MAKLVDALVSGTSDGNIVQVRVLLRALRPSDFQAAFFRVYMQTFTLLAPFHEKIALYLSEVFFS